MNSLEWRAVGGLSLVYALRMLGMFMILPVFAIYARELPGQVSGLQIGLALGAYGLAQALLQIPFGIASDRFGRKSVIVIGMLIFAAGSLIAAATDDIHWIIFGRFVQGAGAVSAAVSALVADITRESVRTTAMGILGVGMGGSFVLALVAGPVLAAWHGVAGIFLLTCVLALLSIPVVLWLVPDAPVIAREPARLSEALADTELLRLNGGIFLLHACMTALFVAAPLALEHTLQLPVAAHWKVYLPVLMLSVVPAFLLIRYGEARNRIPSILPAMVAALAAALVLAALSWNSAYGLVAGLLLYFAAFNFLEGALPSLVSKWAPPARKGAAMGTYATSQFLGGFAGGVLGGFALGHFGPPGVFACAAMLPLLWLTFSIRYGRRSWHVASTK
ncbi:MAG: MFS transporter [Pseudomonadota bacterium]